ncbi:MAG: Glu-tRNA(Gln) amidotransferase subunit GatE [Candidatus Pacearchaeota archaeon]
MEEQQKQPQVKIGIEIHQQLDTNKLFCSCPSVLRQDEPTLIIKRKMKAVVGETGEIDEAAAFEQAKEREFIYEAYKDSNCLVELDEEPPHEINKEALVTCLQVALLLNCRIFPVTQVMRKTIINGSCVSGFQRTILVAEDGFFEIEVDGRKKKIGIQSIALEEDAAREIERTEKSVTFRLDRLGIPLIELTTKPDISSPEEAKIAALKLGEILRACKVKRGIGTIRQDVNISVGDHPRVEIKGVQEPDLIVRVLEYEIKRQQQEKIKKPEVRKANQDGSTTFIRPLAGAARMYPETDLPLIYTSEFVKEAKKTLPKLKEEIQLELRERGMNPEFIKLILQEQKLEEFKALEKIVKKPNLIAKMLVLWPKEIARSEKFELKEVEKKLSTDLIEFLLEKVAKGEISEAQIKQVMLDVVRGKELEKAIKQEKVDLHEVENYIQQLLKTKQGLSFNAYMGLIMQKYKGKINPRDAADILKKYVKGF